MGVERVEALVVAEFWDDLPVFFQIVAVQRGYGASGNISILCSYCRKERLHTGVAAGAVLHVD